MQMGKCSPGERSETREQYWIAAPAKSAGSNNEEMLDVSNLAHCKHRRMSCVRCNTRQNPFCFAQMHYAITAWFNA